LIFFLQKKKYIIRTSVHVFLGFDQEVHLGSVVGQHLEGFLFLHQIS
jgi:hypothetical protein